jgi:LCP family protein required for cell wall assembly
VAAAASRSSGHRRTWPERLAIGASIVAAVLCFATAGGLVAAYMVLHQRKVIEITNPAEERPTADAGAAPAEPSTTPPPADGTVARQPDAPTTTTPPTFPPADPAAKNFLITGADNGACIDPNSPFAGAFGDREDMGERSDTIMVFRVDPSASRVAVLSFPRDLYVTIAGSGNQARINSAYERDEPQRLIDTIYENFGVGVDHFIQVDFCAFKTLVDAVGGVSVPFRYPARDTHTGLNVPTTGCFKFDGEHALAYVRSRYYEYEDPPGSGNWEQDQSFDLGRISRQQDFLRRTLSSVLAKGPLNPRVARGLIKSATQYIVTDSGLSPAKLLEFAGVLDDVEPAGILTYQIEATPREVSGASVLEPQIDGENMQAVLAMFRGETSLADAPTQVFGSTTTAVPRPTAPGTTAPGTTTPGLSSGELASGPSSSAPPPSTAPAGPAPEENTFGIVPPRDKTC